MQSKIALLALFITLFSFNTIAQNKINNKKSINDEITYYYKDGVKMSRKNKTPLTFTNLQDNAIGNTPDEMALNWVLNNKELLKIDKIANLKIRFKRSSLSGHTVRLQQILNNIPVYHSEIVVHISPKNKITYVANTFDPSVQQINTIPSISKQQAIQFAKNELKVNGGISYSDNKLTVYNSNKTKLVYQVIIEPKNPAGSWEVLVDAQNGNILKVKDIAYSYKHPKKSYLLPQPAPVNGTGNVFLSDPLSAANVTYGGNYSDNNDATNAQLDAAMSSVTLLDIDNTGGTYTLKGPYAEIKDFEAPNKGLFTQGSSTFNFNRNDDAFEAVNCYYLIDKSMRYINVTLGIPLMPFQYTTGVRYDPHGLNGADNSHYLGGSGGIAFGEGGVDDAEDADVVVHELGHGIHDWLTGGALSQVDGLSEGSGDYWGQSYSHSLNQWTTGNAEYYWFFNWDGHNPFWNGRITNYTATYPGGLTGSIHTDGQIWATTLMRIYEILGREKVDKAFLEGLAMTNSSTNQQDAAIAVRQAAINMGYSCPDIDVFTQEFTATGYNMPPLNPIGPAPIITDTTQCDGTSAIINSNGFSLNWYSDFGLTNLLSTGTSFNTGQTTSGIYTYYAAYSSGVCTAAPADTVVLTITACGTVPVANLSVSSSNICSTTCVNFTDLSTSSPTSWIWYFFGASTATSTTQNPTNICYSTSGTYDVSLVVNNANGQDSTYMANYITVNALPNITASTNTSICLGNSTSISASGGNTYSWDNGLGAGASQTVNPTTTTTYTVTGTDTNVCSNTAQVTITVNALPTITASANTSVCLGNSTSISAFGGNTYSWDNGLGVGASQTVSPTTTTTYTVIGTDTNVCSNTDQVIITVNALPTITASANITICTGDFTNISATGGTSYSWNNGLGTGAIQTVNPTTTTVYIVTGADTNNCSNSDTVTVTVTICVGINEVIADNVIQVYPNPTSDELNIIIKDFNSETDIRLIDNLGRVIYQVTPTNNKTVVNLGKLAKGIYTLVVNIDDKIITKKIIKD